MPKPEFLATQPGQIAAAVAAGFQPELLLPIAPASADGFTSRGKVPCRWGRDNWAPVAQWQNGLTPRERDTADEHGCNVGLILGVPVNGWQYLTLDVDTEPGNDPSVDPDPLALKIAGFAASALVSGLGAPIWARLSRPARLSFVFRLPGTVSPGVKKIGYLKAKDGTAIGKLELLARGQQTVIGGVHEWAGGTPMRWKLAGKKGSVEQPFPTMEHIPIIDSREKLDDLIALVTTALNVRLGITTDYKRTLLVPGLEEEALSADDQAPWNPQAFIGLFVRMPHDHRVNRDDYVSTMLAASAAVQAAERLKLADATECRAMTEAAVAWAARWEDPKGDGTTVEDEFEAWENDWSTRTVNHLGWNDLMRRAIQLGDDQISYDWACLQFSGDCIDLPKPADPGVPRNAPNGTPQGQPLETRSKIDVKTADIQIARAIQNVLGDRYAWVKGTKQWVTWGGVTEGWSGGEAGADIRVDIARQLSNYVALHNESLGDSDDKKAKLLSEARIRAIENILKSNLTRKTEDFDRGEYMIQTPGGAWDLRTASLIPATDWERQRACYERRMTAYTPVDGPTPLFDSILSHLAEGDQEVIDWLWAFFGYCLLGKPNEDKILVLHGPGGNGKTKLANILSEIFGSYAITLDRKVIVKSGAKEHATGLYQAKGKRLWCVPELEAGEEWNESQIKAMAGSDKITARGMHQDMQNFKAEGALFIYTNHVPSFHRIGEAVTRRLCMLHARMPVPDESKNVKIEEETLEQEGGAILLKLIQAASRVYRLGLPKPPRKMRKEAERYLLTQDTFGAWFGKECKVVRVEEDELVCVEDLHMRYMAWTKRIQGSSSDDDDGIIAGDFLGAGAFWLALKNAGALMFGDTGHQLKDDQGRKMCRGIALKIAAVRAA